MLAADEKGRVADAAFEGGEGAAQGGFGAAVVVFGPQESGKCFTGVGLAGEGEVGQQGNGFASVGFHKLLVAFQPGRAEKVEFNVSHTAIVAHFRCGKWFVTVFVTFSRRWLGRV